MLFLTLDALYSAGAPLPQNVYLTTTRIKWAVDSIHRALVEKLKAEFFNVARGQAQCSIVSRVYIRTKGSPSTSTVFDCHVQPR